MLKERLIKIYEDAEAKAKAERKAKIEDIFDNYIVPKLEKAAAGRSRFALIDCEGDKVQYINELVEMLNGKGIASFRAGNFINARF